MGVWEKVIRKWTLEQAELGWDPCPATYKLGDLGRWLSLSEPLCITCKKRVVIVPTLQICGK